jgi:hypothetical protein
MGPSTSLPRPVVKSRICRFAVPLHVRFGSLADICSAKRHVRFTPNADIATAPELTAVLVAQHGCTRNLRGTALRAGTIRLAMPLRCTRGAAAISFAPALIGCNDSTKSATAEPANALAVLVDVGATAPLQMASTIKSSPHRRFATPSGSARDRVTDSSSDGAGDDAAFEPVIAGAGAVIRSKWNALSGHNRMLAHVAEAMCPRVPVYFGR